MPALPMKYRSVSSQVLVQEANALGLKVDVICKEKNLFLVSSETKDILFKSTDWGGNSSLGHKVSNDKELTYRMLDRHNLPYAQSWYCSRDTWQQDIAGLRDEKSMMLWPVVIKPIDESHGDGVMMQIQSYNELREKLFVSFETYDRMIVQRQIEGDEVRVVVLDNEIIIAIKRIPPVIVGDGMLSVHELIVQENETNPDRGTGYSTHMAKYTYRGGNICICAKTRLSYE